mmetsp:Transcript_22177/g.44555  ORF Transcript_22177/g.44555 Transcript_22177/m.44555 type:complete len:1112 (-) Transcript_22177:51-3386(-)
MAIMIAKLIVSRALLLILLGTVRAAATRSDPYCPHIPNNGDKNNHLLERTLNVHISPHTHDDVGWLKTVDQYFYGLNNTIQQAHVALILDNVLNELQDPYTAHNRTFTYVEMKFFSKWYLALPPALKSSLKELIKKEQFSFANGGWCMHDEAATHYMGMIDQTTLGHQFLLKELGVVPKVGWQIDPFGHSATQGGLLTSSVGFDALYFGRIHYVDLQNRQAAAECEGLWKSAPDNSSVFWGLTGSYSGNYGAPDGFCFDALCADDPLVGLEKDALKERIRLFTNALGVQANRTKGRNIMITMGMDFHYSQARKNFQNLDLLIDSTQQLLDNGEIRLWSDRFDKVNIFYSTPERYTHCKYADLVNAKTSGEGSARSKYNPAKWNTSPKTNDWFPYADCDHCYWTGYFTSRQGLKRMERVGSSFLHAARQIESMARLTLPKDQRIRITDTDAWNASPLYELDDAMGVVQHHDGVSGTSKQHVAYDYAKRIAGGMNKANSFVTDALRKLLLNSNEGVLDNLTYCMLNNETICTVSQEASREGSKEDIYVIVYNALAKERHEVVSLPIDSSSYYFVEKLGGEQSDWVPVESSVLPNANYAQVIGAASNIMHFEAKDIPPLGASVFRVSRLEDEVLSSTSIPAVPRNLRRSVQNDMGDEIVMSNDILSVTFDQPTGVITSITNLRDGITVNVEQQYGFYKSAFKDAPMNFVEDNDNFKGDGKCLPGYTDAEGDEYPWLVGSAENWQNSGAYIFRPTIDQKLHNLPPKRAQSVVVYNSGLVKEVHSVFGQGGWIKQIARLLPGKDFVEIEYIVGPVPIDDGGKEVVSKWTTSIANDGQFFTDSNGREFQKRKRGDHNVFGPDQPNSDEPVSGNYYPVNSIFIEDTVHSFGCVVDRSQGGASLTDGTLELMIQRRTLYDDARGVGEPLNETDTGITPNPPYDNAERLGEGVIVKGHHRMIVGKGGSGASKMRGIMDSVFSQPHVFVASAPSGTAIPFKQATLSMLQTSLPDNIMVISFVALGEENTYLIRLGHQYGPNEDTSLSRQVEIDLHKLFVNNKLTSVQEKTLSGNQMRADWEARRFQWDCSKADYLLSRDNLRDGHVVLKPLEIRTYEIVLS